MRTTVVVAGSSAGGFRSRNVLYGPLEFRVFSFKFYFPCEMFAFLHFYNLLTKDLVVRNYFKLINKICSFLFIKPT